MGTVREMMRSGMLLMSLCVLVGEYREFEGGSDIVELMRFRQTDCFVVVTQPYRTPFRPSVRLKERIPSTRGYFALSFHSNNEASSTCSVLSASPLD